mgnify:CR=1 FL=1
MTGISLDPSLVRPDGRPGLLGTLSGVPHSTALLSGGGLTAVDAVLVSVVADPVDLGVGLDNGVCGVHEDDLVPLLLSVGSDPVGVQDLEVGVPLGGPLLGHPLEGLTDCDLVDSLPLGPPTGDDGPLLEGSLPDPRPDDDVALLGLVSESPCPVEAGLSMRQKFSSFLHWILRS